VHDTGRAATCADRRFRLAASEGAVAEDIAGRVGKHGRQFRRIADVGGGDFDAAHQAARRIGCDMRLVAVRRLAAAMTGPARLAIVLDAGGSDQRRVDQRAGAHPEVLRLELSRDGVEHHAVQLVLDQRGAEPHEGGALGCRLVRGEAAEATEADTVIERLGKPDVGEVVPGRQEQRAEQRRGRPAGLTLRRR
jgi:hypothetical protein